MLNREFDSLFNTIQFLYHQIFPWIFSAGELLYANFCWTWEGVKTTVPGEWSSNGRTRRSYLLPGVVLKQYLLEFLSPNLLFDWSKLLNLFKSCEEKIRTQKCAAIFRAHVSRFTRAILDLVPRSASPCVKICLSKFHQGTKLWASQHSFCRPFLNSLHRLAISWA